MPSFSQAEHSIFSTHRWRGGSWKVTTQIGPVFMQVILRIIFMAINYCGLIWHSTVYKMRLLMGSDFASPPLLYRTADLTENQGRCCRASVLTNRRNASHFHAGSRSCFLLVSLRAGFLPIFSLRSSVNFSPSIRDIPCQLNYCLSLHTSTASI